MVFLAPCYICMCWLLRTWLCALHLVMKLIWVNRRSLLVSLDFFVLGHCRIRLFVAEVTGLNLLKYVWFLNRKVSTSSLDVLQGSPTKYLKYFLVNLTIGSSSLVVVKLNNLMQSRILGIMKTFKRLMNILNSLDFLNGVILMIKLTILPVIPYS